MRYLLAVLVFALPALQGCEPGPNYPPEIEFARAGCRYDGFQQDVVWTFDARVRDPNGFADVDAVWADVYDMEDPGAEPLESFPLFSRRHGETARRIDWYSDWLEFSTVLDCGYPEYEVDIVAYDRAGELDVVTVIPYR